MFVSYCASQSFKCSYQYIKVPTTLLPGTQGYQVNSVISTKEQLVIMYIYKLITVQCVKLHFLFSVSYKIQLYSFNLNIYIRLLSNALG